MEATSASATRDLLSFAGFFDLRRSSLLRSCDVFSFDIDDSLFPEVQSRSGIALVFCVNRLVTTATNDIAMSSRIE